jgi:predicted nucleic acid binding AN1-type Zn finger protein
MHKGGLACIMQLPQMCALVGSVKVWVSCPAETGKVRLARSCTAISCFFFFLLAP